MKLNEQYFAKELYTVETLQNFITELIRNLHRIGYIRIGDKFSEYDLTKMYQSNVSKYQFEWNSDLFILSYDGEKFNLEVCFSDEKDVVYQIPYIDDNVVQEKLKNFFEALIQPSDIINKFQKFRSHIY